VKSKVFLVGFFLVVAAIAAVSIAINESVDKADKTFTALASPDGKYKAVRVSLSRGGDKPFCFDTIAIYLSVYPDSFAESDKTYQVYAAPCAAPAERANLPKIEWLAADAVRITVPPAAAGEKMKRKDIDASKFVHVTFVPAQ
jgi:hypothetical protein